MRRTAVLAAMLAAASTGPALAQSGGYAGQQTREIKALSSQDVADYLAGRGMGLARAAELNQHPGPAHVIELRDKLALTPEQEAAARAAFTRMEAAAKALGAELVERERAVDQAFAERAITDAGLAEQTAAIGTLQGRVRGVHLAAHIAMRHILTPEQVTRYDELRGYAGNPTTSAPAQHGHGSRAH